MNRRDVLAGMGATALGALGVIAAEKTYAEATITSPLQFYGGFASGVRPDLSPPPVSGSSVVWSGMTDTRRMALTFDDGPMPDWTPQVIRALARHDVPATFFLKGINVQRHGLVTIDNLDAIITGLKDDGFAFTTVSELCGLSGGR